MGEEEIHKGHNTTRDILRAVGPVFIGIGLIFIIIGIGSFFSAFGGNGPPKNFWCMFVGMPILAIGIGMTKFGYMGKVAGYIANEIAPVGKDTINYMVDGTKDSIREVAQAVEEGLAESRGQEDVSTIPQVLCHKCNSLSQGDSNFCSNCGAALKKSKACPKCDELNDPDAKFCDNCGYKYMTE